MKLNKDYIMSELGDESVLVPTGQASSDFHGVIRLNETAAFIVNCMKKDAEAEKIAEALTGEYDVDIQTAEKHVTSVLEKLRKIGAIDE